jgi:hypothetical protein
MRLELLNALKAHGETTKLSLTDLQTTGGGAAPL